MSVNGSQPFPTRAKSTSRRAAISLGRVGRSWCPSRFDSACHAGGREFESRRPRQLNQGLRSIGPSDSGPIVRVLSVFSNGHPHPRPHLPAEDCVQPSAGSRAGSFRGSPLSDGLHSSASASLQSACPRSAMQEKADPVLPRSAAIYLLFR